MFATFNNISEAKLDMWEFQPKPCERCPKVFHNEYYYLTHNRFHLEIRLSRDEVNNYLARNQPKTENEFSDIKNKEILLVDQKPEIINETKNTEEKVLQTFIMFKKLLQEDYVLSPKLPCHAKQYTSQKKVKTCTAKSQNIFSASKLENTERQPTNSCRKKNVAVKRKNLNSSKHINKLNPHHDINKDINSKQNCEGKVTTRSSFRCTSCFIVFTKKVQYLSHIKRKKCQNLPVTCLICKSIWKTEMALEAHMKRIHSGKEHFCYICNIFYKHPRRLLNHIHRVHKSNNDYVPVYSTRNPGLVINGKNYRVDNSKLKDIYVRNDNPESYVIRKSFNEYICKDLRTSNVVESFVTEDLCKKKIKEELDVEQTNTEIEEQREADIKVKTEIEVKCDLEFEEQFL